MTRAVLSPLRSLAAAAMATIAITMSAPASAAGDVVENYPDLAAYREFCRMPDYYQRYPAFCSGFFGAAPCADDYACDERSYPMRYDSYREYTYQAPFGDPYRGTAYCGAHPNWCYARGRY